MDLIEFAGVGHAGVVDRILWNPNVPTMIVGPQTGYKIRLACALLLLPPRLLDVQPYERSRSLCTEKSLRVIRYSRFQL